MFGWRLIEIQVQGLLVAGAHLGRQGMRETGARGLLLNDDTRAQTRQRPRVLLLVAPRLHPGFACAAGGRGHGCELHRDERRGGDVYAR